MKKCVTVHKRLSWIRRDDEQEHRQGSPLVQKWMCRFGPFLQSLPKKINDELGVEMNSEWRYTGRKNVLGSDEVGQICNQRRNVLLQSKTGGWVLYWRSNNERQAVVKQN